jgi:hypothetical protein
MIVVCIDYMLLIIMYLRYVSISYICRAIWLVAKSRYSGECGCAACGMQECRILNSKQNSAHNDSYCGAHPFLLSI